MDVFEPSPSASRAVHTQDDSVMLFVSLYVVVLAFFILLTSHATVDKKKSQDVLASVSATFSSATRTQVQNYLMNPEKEDLPAFSEEIQYAIASVLPLARVEITRKNGILRVSMPASDLFVPGSTHLRPERASLYEQLLPILLEWHQKTRVETLFIQTLQNDQETPLSIARGGYFARFLENEGIAPQNIKLGVEPDATDQEQVIFEFHLYAR